MMMTEIIMTEKEMGRKDIVVEVLVVVEVVVIAETEDQQQ